MSSSIALVSMIECLYRQLGVTDLITETELTQGCKQLEAGLLRIAVDICTAKTRGVALADAVQDDLEYPHLYNAHAIIGDVLTMSVPNELEHWVGQFHQMPMPPVVEELRSALIMVASGIGPMADAAHFLLFEGVRMSLLYSRWRIQDALAAVAADEREQALSTLLEEEALDVIAEREVDCMIELAPHIPEGVDPFHPFVAAALRGLATHIDELRRLIENIDNDLVVSLARRAKFDQAVHELDAVDAALLRNHVAAQLGEQPLSTKQLQRTHPMLLGTHSTNALDQRLSRLRRQIRTHGTGALAPRTRPSLFQLMGNNS